MGIDQRPWPRTRFSPSVRTAVADAGMALWAMRSRLCQELADGTARDCHIGAVGDDVNPWLTEWSPTWQHLLSVRPTAIPEQLRLSLPHNRAMVRAGLEMVSVFDYERLDDECRQMIVDEPLGDYLFACCDTQIKVIDREVVLLEGPIIDGDMSVLVARSSKVLELTMRYWNAVLASAFDCAQEGATDPDLSLRQQRIIRLMRSGMTDEAMARSLEVSVRTVRSDVAQILEALEVRSRFSAGWRLAQTRVREDG